MAHQPVSGDTKLEYQTEFVALKILDATPNQVARLLRGEIGDIALVNQQNTQTRSACGSGSDRSIDSRANNCDIVLSVFVRISLILFGHTASIEAQSLRRKLIRFQGGN